MVEDKYEWECKERFYNGSDGYSFVSVGILLVGWWCEHGWDVNRYPCTFVYRNE